MLTPPMDENTRRALAQASLLIGCSFTFETSLVQAGIRYITDVPNANDHV